MRERTGQGRVEVTLSALLAAVSGVTDDEDEAFELLESILEEGWVAIVPERKAGPSRSSWRARPPHPPTAIGLDSIDHGA